MQTAKGGDMSDMRNHRTAGRRRRHKSPAVGHLAPPALPDHLRDDEDGLTRIDEEKGAKRMRSASTTPRSFRGTDPDYDRVMGVTSVGPQETARFGEGNATEFEVDQKGAANNSDNLSEARAASNPHIENTDDDPGAGRRSRGFESFFLRMFG